MNQTIVRNTVLSKLSKAPQGELPERPELSAFPEMMMTTEELVETFTQNVALHTGVVHRVKSVAKLLEKLKTVLIDEAVKEIALSDDELVRSVGLEILDGNSGLSVVKISDFNDREGYKNYLFTKADAGITGADFAVAESGTIVITHDKNHARLVSLAPALHIAVVPMEKLVPVYEVAVKDIFKESKPSQVTFITGPSMTADIQATPFKGMHGPKKLIIFLIG